MGGKRDQGCLRQQVRVKKGPHQAAHLLEIQPLYQAPLNFALRMMMSHLALAARFSLNDMPTPVCGPTVEETPYPFEPRWTA
jgi:hypothetical protein